MQFTHHLLHSLFSSSTVFFSPIAPNLQIFQFLSVFHSHSLSTSHILINISSNPPLFLKFSFSPLSTLTIPMASSSSVPPAKRTKTRVNRYSDADYYLPVARSAREARFDWRGYGKVR
ncbi:hypothetical protein RIF29_08999 [Crotalaria pallida]|uniref:Uncharacterized protein n=1 Tax=Crotalaria pallida TaxID=3830 RepID=A0AAN9FRI1_CROPI